MKIALNILGGLMMLFGTTWFLQGINILPGSFMTGDLHWAVYGGIAIILGVAVLLKANRMRRKS
jgi:hypothetical protein